MRPMLAKSVAVAFVLILAGCSQQPVACGRGGGDCSGNPVLSLADGGTPTGGLNTTGVAGWTLDFGEVSVGAPASVTILLQNYGCAPLQILSSTPPSNAEFTIALTSGEIIEPMSCLGDAGVLSIPLGFTPFDAGTTTATATFQTDSSFIQTVTLTLTGTGVN